MARQVVEANARTYEIAPEGAVPLTQRYWGIVQARIVDELTSATPRVPVRLESHSRGFIPQSASGHLVGLVARPGLVFPKLAERSYDVSFTILAAGYVPHRLDVSVPVNPQFPVRTIDPASDPNPGDDVLTLGSVDGITVGETLLVGRPGNRERVEVTVVDPVTQQVTFAPNLANDHDGGDLVVAEQLLPFDPSTSISDLGDIALHRPPVVIEGRVIRRRNGTATAVPNANVTVTGLWRVLLPAAVEPPAAAPNIVSLDPPLYFTRSAGSADLRRREMAPVVGEDKLLLEMTHPGEARLDLSNRVNLSAGDVVLVDADPAIQEFLTIDTIEPVGAADLPGPVRLTHAPAHFHRAGALVRRVIPQAPGPNRSLSEDAIAGDVCLLLSSLAGLSGVEVVELHGGAAPAEYHRLNLFSSVTGAAGRFRLPPLSRVAKLQLEASEGGDATGPIEFIPHYPRNVNQLEVELP